jgi:hypothetical protein
MVRIKASILILALMVAPLASLCGAQSGTPKPGPLSLPNDAWGNARDRRANG